MKKILGLVLTFIFMTNLQIFATGIEIQPTFYTRSNAQDKLWVGTFQLVWNDFMNKIVHNPIRFREGTPITVLELNKQTFTANDISDDCYYKYTGKVTKNTKKTINKAIKKKFKEKSDLLDKLDLTPRNDMFIIYAMLKKDFEFIHAFDKLGKSTFGDNYTTEYFGIDKNSNNELASGVKVLFYNGPDDFAVTLKTKGNDELFLYKNSSNKAFHYIYVDMLKKMHTYTGDSKFKDADELKIPNITFDEEKSFEELVGRRIMGTNLVINQAMETIKFDMNNKGVKLKSEAAMTTMKMSFLPEETPRLFYFDDTFILFLKEKGKKNPYFALRVNDITKFQKDN